MPLNVTPPLGLTGRSSSHFTRVVRMLAHELEIPLELQVVHDLMTLDAATYGGHPALKIPTLHVGTAALFGTENICRELAKLAGRSNDSRVVLPHQVTSVLAQSAQELVWHAMTVQVQLVVGLRLAKLPTESIFFTKATTGMNGSLAWLDERLGQVLAELPSPRDVSVFEVSLFCMVEHIVFRPTLSLELFPRLRGFATAFASRDSAQRTPFQLDPAPTSLQTA